MFIPMNRGGSSRGARAASIAVGVVGAMLAAGHHANKDLTLSTPWVSIAVAGIVLAVAVVFVVRLVSARDDQPAPDEPREASEFSHHLVMVIVVIIAGLLALGLFLALTPRAAASQEQMAAPAAVPQSAYVLTRGSDTIVVERVTRGRSSISGDLTVKGQMRMQFIAELAPGPFVPSLTFRAWGAGADVDTPPIQTGSQTLTADSAIITIAGSGGARRLARAIKNRPLAIMNNDFATTELVIQRARAMGVPKATVPVFTLTGGAQLDLTVEFIGADSAIVTIAAANSPAAPACPSR